MTKFTNNFFFFFFIETILFIVVETTNSLLIVAELLIVVEYSLFSECFSKFCLIVKFFVDVVIKSFFFANDATTTEFLFVNETTNLLVVTIFLNLTISRRISFFSWIFFFLKLNTFNCISFNRLQIVFQFQFKRLSSKTFWFKIFAFEKTFFLRFFLNFFLNIKVINCSVWLFNKMTLIKACNVDLFIFWII